VPHGVLEALEAIARRHFGAQLALLVELAQFAHAADAVLGRLVQQQPWEYGLLTGGALVLSAIRR
jgi:hypothetical protein